MISIDDVNSIDSMHQRVAHSCRLWLAWGRDTDDTIHTNDKPGYVERLAADETVRMV